MGNKREFKNIANGLLSSFISRNNDINGYWGIGKLYAFMLKSKSMRLEVDLIENTILPHDNELKILASIYLDYLLTRMKIKNIERECLNKAMIVLSGFPNNLVLPYGRSAPHKMHCKILIIDNLNKEYSIEKNVWCRKHNPKSELKSGRNYEN